MALAMVLAQTRAPKSANTSAMDLTASKSVPFPSFQRLVNAKAVMKIAFSVVLDRKTN